MSPGRPGLALVVLLALVAPVACGDAERLDAQGPAALHLAQEDQGSGPACLVGAPGWVEPKPQPPAVVDDEIRVPEELKAELVAARVPPATAWVPPDVDAETIAAQKEYLVRLDELRAEYKDDAAGLESARAALKVSLLGGGQ